MDAAIADARGQRLQEFLRSESIPNSYLHNSTAEEELLNFADDFRVIFHKYYPDRKPLLLSPKNECQKRKMICTFIRPTSLRFDRLFDLESCCKFVSGYMQYETLYNPEWYDDNEDDRTERFPALVVSPRTTLEWQIGNCLEISLVMTSLLSGFGFKAYVVVGYAKQWVCLNDQSERRSKFILPVEHNSDDDPDPEPELDPDYAALLVDRPVLRHTDDPELLFASSEDVSENDEESVHVDAAVVEEVPKKKLAHCWVLVLAGGRKAAKAPVFVEPSTGEIVPIERADDFYTGVESVFSDTEYFVNIRPEALVSSLSTNLKDNLQWEPLFPIRDDDDDHETTASTMMMGATRRNMNEFATTFSANLLDRGNSSNSTSHVPTVPKSWVAEITLSPKQFESQFPECGKVFEFNDATVKLYAAYSQRDLRVKEIIIPDNRYHNLTQVHTFYAHRKDKLRRRSLYPAPQAIDALTAGRNAMNPSSPAPSYRLLCEWYDQGRFCDVSVEGLREFFHEPGKSRTMKFYWKAREDGLFCREELFYDAGTLRKVKEHYKGRADHLYYRSASYDKPRSIRETNAHNIIVNPADNTNAKDYPRLEPIRMSQKFSRNESVPFHSDVAKMTFIRPPPTQTSAVGEMWLFFQHSDTSIVRPYHMFAKSSSNVEDYIAASASRKPTEPPAKVVTMPGMPPPSDLELYNERKWLASMENKCLADIRAKVAECLDIVVAMSRDDNVVNQVLSSYDTLRNRPKETEAERAQKLADVVRREESRKDYLAPYIAKLDMAQSFDGDYLKVKLTPEQAKQVRDEALSELKERLIQRGHIMQTRMDKEKEEFNNKQLAYQKSSDAVVVDGSKDAEEFAQYCKEATWRMKVLDERLSKHIDLASEKYAQLAQRLSEDPRLTALYGTGN